MKGHGFSRAAASLISNLAVRIKLLPDRGRRASVIYGMNDFRSHINSLSAAEKAELLDTAWESLEADALPLTVAQRAELDYRITRHEQNPSDVIPWPQVKADLFKKP